VQPLVGNEKSAYRQRPPNEESGFLEEYDLTLAFAQKQGQDTGVNPCHRSLPNTAGDLPRFSQKLIIRESSWFSTK
jgi:hypothetical protein